MPPAPRSIRSDVPAELDAVIMRALAKEPSDRPRSAVEIRGALTATARS